MSTDALIALLDRADAADGARELRDHTYRLLALTRGDPVADIGCGAGRAVAELGRLGVRAVGVDLSDRMLDAARLRWPGVRFERGDAAHLPFGDGELRGYRADKVFHELAEPAVALAEARRVLAPGGRIVVAGHDWDTFVIDSDRPAETRTIVHARADAIVNPRIARSYRNLLLDNGFSEVRSEVRTGVFTDGTLLPSLTAAAEAALPSTAAAAWAAEQAERVRTGRFFAAIPMFLASATRS